MADKAIGELDAVPEIDIKDLPAASSIYDTTLIPVEYNGKAQRISGLQLKLYTQLNSGGSDGGGGSDEDTSALAQAVVQAQQAAQDAENAKQSIENMQVAAETLTPGSQATVKKTVTNGVTKLTFGIPEGRPGKDGADGEDGGGTGTLPDNLVTIEGGAHLVLVGDFGDPPYEITIVKGESGTIIPTPPPSTTQYSVSLSVDPSGGGTVSGAGNYDDGTSVTVRATSASGYTFSGWRKNGAIVSTSINYTFTIDSNVSLVAVFAESAVTPTPPSPTTEYSVSLSVDPSGSGTTAGAGSYNSGSSVTVKATAASGYTFSSWKKNGTVVSTSSSYTFTINANTTLVAVFTKSSFLPSLTWIEASVTDYSWQRAAYGNGRFVAIAQGQNGWVAYSTDKGVSWKTTALGSVTDPYRHGIAFGAGVFVVVGEGLEVKVSSDGANWRDATITYNKSWWDVTYGNKKFVAVSDSDESSYSTDGINWTAASMPSSAKWYCVAYGNGKYVAIANGSNKAAYSLDGITWKATTMPTSALWQDVAYGNGRFVAIGLEGEVAYSTDGVKWTDASGDLGYNWTTIVFDNGKFMTSGGTISVDGIVWESSAATLPGTSRTSFDAIAYGADRWVALSDSGGYAAYALDPE